MMLKYTLHTFTLTLSHITWVHVTSFQSQSNKILIDIYNKILNFDMQIFHCIAHPQKVFTQLPKRNLLDKMSQKNYGQWGHKTQIPGHIP